MLMGVCMQKKGNLCCKEARSPHLLHHCSLWPDVKTAGVFADGCVDTESVVNVQQSILQKDDVLLLATA